MALKLAEEMKADSSPSPSLSSDGRPKAVPAGQWGGKSNPISTSLPTPVSMNGSNVQFPSSSSSSSSSVVSATPVIYSHPPTPVYSNATLPSHHPYSNLPPPHYSSLSPSPYSYPPPPQPYPTQPSGYYPSPSYPPVYQPPSHSYPSSTGQYSTAATGIAGSNSVQGKERCW